MSFSRRTASIAAALVLGFSAVGTVATVTEYAAGSGIQAGGGDGAGWDIPAASGDNDGAGWDSVLADGAGWDIPAASGDNDGAGWDTPTPAGLA